MYNHFDLSDNAFEFAFQNCSLPPEVFTHEAHLRLAWIHLKKYGAEKAISNICDQLTKYVESVGAKDKYNETLTIAAIKATQHFMEKSSSENFTDFIVEFPILKNNFKEIIEFHYGFDVFHSEEAKKTYIAPDLLPFE